MVRKIQINLSNKVFYSLMTLVIIFALAFVVYAAAPNPGHDISEIDTSEGLIWDSSRLVVDQGGAIELGGQNSIANPVSDGRPYIDFHYGTGSAEDRNVRVINDADGQLTLEASTVRVTGNLNVEGSGSGSGGLKPVVGATSSSYDGAGVGGYSGGDAKCAADFGTGARMCSAADFALGIPSPDGWFNTFIASAAGAVGSSVDAVNDCGGWTATTSGGNLFLDNTGIGGAHLPAAVSCTASFPILCCK